MNDIYKPVAIPFVHRTLFLLASILMFVPLYFLVKLNDLFMTPDMISSYPKPVMPIALAIIIFGVYLSISFFISHVKSLKDGIKPILHERFTIKLNRIISPIKVDGNKVLSYLIIMLALHVIAIVSTYFIAYGQSTLPAINPDFSKGDDYYARLHLLAFIAIPLMMAVILRLTFKLEIKAKESYDEQVCLLSNLIIAGSFCITTVHVITESLDAPIQFTALMLTNDVFFAISIIAISTSIIASYHANNRNISLFTITVKSGLLISLFCVVIAYLMADSSIAKSSHPSYGVNKVSINGSDFNYKMGVLAYNNQGDDEHFIQGYSGLAMFDYYSAVRGVIPHAKGIDAHIIHNIANYSLSGHKKLIDTKDNIQAIKQDRVIDVSTIITIILQEMSIENQHPDTIAFFDKVVNKEYQSASNLYLNNFLNRKPLTQGKSSNNSYFYLSSEDIRTTMALMIFSDLANLDSSRINSKAVRTEFVNYIDKAKKLYDNGTVIENALSKEQLEHIAVF